MIGLLIAFNWRSATVAIRQGSIIAIIFMLTISPWLLRNYELFGRVSLSPLAPYYLLVETVTQMEAIRTGGNWATVRTGLLREAEAHMRADGLDPNETDQYVQSAYWQRMVVEHLTSYPGLLVRVYVAGLIHTFANLLTSVYARLFDLPMEQVNMKVHLNLVDLGRTFFERRGFSGLGLAILLSIQPLIAYVGALIGIVVWWKQHDRRYLLYLLVMMAYFLAIAGAGGNARYRMPIIPAYLALAGVGLGYAYDAVLQRRRKARVAASTHAPAEARSLAPPVR
jgi:hypothetical protein